MALNLKALLGMLFVFIGCCSNVVFLELIIQIDPGAGNLITFAQFLFISLTPITGLGYQKQFLISFVRNQVFRVYLPVDVYYIR